MSIDSFSDRFSSDYLNLVSSMLSLDGEYGMLNNALPLERSKEVILHNKKYIYEKVARISFCGIAGTTLLDISGSHTKNTAAIQFEKLIGSLRKLNKEKVLLKVNFLFPYPYSDFAFSLIQAEANKNRPAMDEKEYTIGFDNTSVVDEETFFASSTLRNQKSSLQQIQTLLEKNNVLKTPHKLQVRFSPIPINLCTLIINNTVFYDPYLYSKVTQKSNKLSNRSALIKIKKEDGEIYFNSIEDHFRYLWTHPSTLFSADATEYLSSKKGSLSKIINPYNIKFDNKAKRMSEIPANKNVTINQMNSWKFQQQQLLINYTRNIQKLPSKEKVFIACSWEPSGTGSYKPSHYAKILKEYLNLDFQDDSEYVLEADYVASEPGGQLHNKIYTSLRNSTLGIFILTKDIFSVNGQHYSKPNVYQELGFLMNQLNSNETRRVLVLIEDGTYLPSNIQDFEHISFKSNKFELIYWDIVMWLKGVTFVTPKQINKAKKAFLLKLKKMVMNGIIDHKEFQSTKELLLKK